jgi:hypothetical protein
MEESLKIVNIMLNDKKLKEILVVPLTDLVVEKEGANILISHSSGLCKALTINESGFRIWELIDGKRCVDDIIKINYKYWNTKLSKQRRVSEDILDFLTNLAIHGCVEFVHRSSIDAEKHFEKKS